MRKEGCGRRKRVWQEKGNGCNNKGELVITLYIINVYMYMQLNNTVAIGQKKTLQS